MCKIKCEIKDGLIASEAIARIQTVEGHCEDVVVSRKSIVKGGWLNACEINRVDDKVLVELPRETTSGYWRVWVRPDQTE